MYAEYVINPDEQEHTIYSLDEDDANLPSTLPRGPYYDSFEAIPIRATLVKMEELRRQEQYKKEQELEQRRTYLRLTNILTNLSYEDKQTLIQKKTLQIENQISQFDNANNDFYRGGKEGRIQREREQLQTWIKNIMENNPEGVSEYDLNNLLKDTSVNSLSSPQMLRGPTINSITSPQLLRGPTINSPVRSSFTLPLSPRQELGLSPPNQLVSSSQLEIPDDDLNKTLTLNIRQWTIIKSIPLRPDAPYKIDEESCDQIMRTIAGEDANYITRDNEIYFCSPGSILYAYQGIYKITQAFSKLTRQVPNNRLDVDGKTAVVSMDLYSGSLLVGTFEPARTIRGLPGQFYSLPSDMQTKIMSYLDPAELISFCNVNMRNRSLCQDRSRSVWSQKLLQLDPLTDLSRIDDPFHHFLRYYYGGKVLTYGINYQGELGRMVDVNSTFQELQSTRPYASELPVTITSNNNPNSPPTYYNSRDIAKSDLPALINLWPGPGVQNPSGKSATGNIVDLACGSGVTAIISTTGELYITRQNIGGFGGERPYNELNNFFDEINVGTAMQVASGDRFVIVLLRGGLVATFGNNNYGKLGYVSTDERYENTERYDPDMPAQPEPFILDIKDAVQVAAGSDHSAVVLKDGKLITFGNNEFGQLGRVTKSRQVVQSWGSPRLVNFDYMPKSIPNVNNVKQVACGESHTLVLLEGGRVASFGSNKHGQLGRKTTIENGYERSMASDSKVEVIKEFVSATAVSCADHYSAVLVKDGKVATFGSNKTGQLGRYSIENINVVPTVVAGISKARTISCGNHFMLVVLKNGGVMQLGGLPSDDYNRPTTVNYKPKLLPRITTAIAASVGDHHAAILVMNRGF